MGGINREQAVLYLCVNMCILMAECVTWLNESQQLICTTLCVRHVCALCHPAGYTVCIYSSSN